MIFTCFTRKKRKNLLDTVIAQIRNKKRREKKKLIFILDSLRNARNLPPPPPKKKKIEKKITHAKSTFNTKRHSLRKKINAFLCQVG